MTDGAGFDGAPVGVDGRVRLPVDVAMLAVALGVALRSAGLPAGPDRCERLARAVTVMGASTIAELHACALATMVSDPSQVDTFERVFAEMFVAGAPQRPGPMAPQQGMTMESAESPSSADPPSAPGGSGELPPVPQLVDADSSASITRNRF